jgi:hypothetical protein
VSSNDGGRPSRASMREVKREYKQRQKADKARAKAARTYWDQQVGTPSRSRAWIAPTAAVVAVGVVAGGLFAAKVGPFAAGGTTTAASSPTAATSPAGSRSTTTPAAKPSTSATNDGTDATVHAAFEGSPARSWKKGMAGIALPHPRQVGIYRSSQVTEAYRMTEKYLAAGSFDSRVLYRAAVDPVLTAFGPQFPSYAKKQHALWVRTKGKQGVSWLWLMSRFHPGDWKASAENRSRGRVSSAVVVGGHLRVSFVVVVAYWLVPASGGAGRAVAVRREGYVDFVGYGPTHVWMTQWRNDDLNTGAVCGSRWKYPEFLEVWKDTHAVPVVSPSQASGAYDLTDPNATPVKGTTCFYDTSGFDG